MVLLLASFRSFLVPRMARKHFHLIVGIALFLVILYYAPPFSTRDAGLWGSNYKHSHKSKWSSIEQKYPVKTFQRIPTRAPDRFPNIQSPRQIESSDARRLRISRLSAVKSSFLHSWTGYRKYAWLRDELAPLSRGHHEAFGNWSATLVDSLDTLWIMGLTEEFDEATAALSSIDFASSTTKTISVFETTIRYLGGLLSAYDLSGRKIFLEKAVALGDMLYAAFDTPNRMPVPYWDWESYLQGKPQDTLAHAVSADIGSLSMEFTRLTQITGDPRYFDAVQRITDIFAVQQNMTALPGMWPVFVNAQSGDFRSGEEFSLGALADSLYEYLPKMHILLGGVSPVYEKMYKAFLNAASRSMFFRPMNPGNENVLIAGTVRVNDGNVMQDASGQHLGCFVGGMIGIGARVFENSADLDLASKVTKGCVWAYKSMRHGIMPEGFKALPCDSLEDCRWDEQKWATALLSRLRSPEGSDANKVASQRGIPPGFLQITDGRYILRPEAIESVFVMYRITGDVWWQNKAWEMFSAINTATKADVAHAAIENVAAAELKQADKMESFWTAETLKYFYLIFSEPDVISLDEYVFNTEAHPFKRPKRSRSWW